MQTAVASRYARALADAVLAPGSATDARAAVTELKGFQSLIESSPELRNVLLSPAVPAGRKRAVAGALAGRSGVSRLVRNFLFVLIDHRRVPVLSEAIAAFEAHIDERLGVVRADIASAAPLTAGQQEQVRGELAHLTGKQVRCDFKVDPGLLGGVVARIGSTIYDGSVRGQLDSLRSQLIG